MKARLTMFGLLVGSLLVVGCSNRRAEVKKAREDAEEKARADAARKEMKALPKTFQTPDYFKKNEPSTQKPETSAPEQAVPKK